MKYIFIAFCALLWHFPVSAQLPKVRTGQIIRLDTFPSRYVDPRTVYIWLPDGYSEREKYAVLYMHDGQMLFDSSLTWNKQAWDVDVVANDLMKRGATRKFIVVGIWNNGTSRHAEYFPQRPFEQMSPAERDTVTAALQRMGRTKERFQPVSDNYLRFLVKELKPYVDKNYSTRKDRKNTFIAGSSMGGLISMYAITQYPKVFGGAACLSTHWPGIFSLENNPVPGAFEQYLRTNLPKPGKNKFYFDYGTATLDALYPGIQVRMDAIMREKGYAPAQWQTLRFEGADHSERAWRARLDQPLLFLLK
jgi:enterochelin esterase-like enzyme